MVAKTFFSPAEFEEILAPYGLGAYIRAEGIDRGTVQTNIFLETTKGKFVFRYYENRSKESVLFESHLLAYLTAQGYPCPAQMKNIAGQAIGTYQGKSYAIFEFMEGQHVERPSTHQTDQLIQKAALLQTLTVDYQSTYTPFRWNYSIELCQSLAEKKAKQLNNKAAFAKLAWLKDTAATLELPSALPKGICHCDFHFSNVLFDGDTFVALLDFDDANYTYLQFDLVCLIEGWAWPHTAVQPNLTKARDIVQRYMSYRPLPLLEQQHLYDVYKLSILIDCIWFFARDDADNFYEKQKIDALTQLGRQQFFTELFD